MKKFGKKGFSLVEMMAVVAILAIVGAFAIPSLISFQKTLKLKELDDSAKSIFMAAQNNLTSLYLSGKADSLNGTKCIPGASPVAYDTDPIEAMLAEAVYLSNGDTTMPTLLPEASIEGVLQTHTYVVEFNPNTGAVIGVFYSENPWTYDYDVDRDFQSRKETMLGYYGGGDVDRPEIGQMPIPEVTLTNNEELTLKVTIPGTTFAGSGKLIFSIGATSANREVFYTFTNVNPNETVTIVLDTLLPESLSGTIHSTRNEPLAISKTLGSSFSGWGFTNITAGDNFSLKVRFEHVSDSGKTLLPQECTVSGNSLFASKSLISIDGDESIDKISVAYGRHLQNLYDPYEPCKVVQTKNIDWKAYYKDEKHLNFISISNWNIEEYDGQNYAIQNMDITGVGLFYDKAEGITIQNLILDRIHVSDEEFGAIISPSTYNAAGVLAQDIDDGDRIENVIVKNSSVASSVPAGGLIGAMVSGTITNCGVYNEIDMQPISTDYATEIKTAYTTYTINGTTAGGLVGRVTGGTIENSFAAVKVGAAAGTAGGLVGEISDATIQNCYAGGFTENGSYALETANVTGATAGGLVGSVTDGAILNSYSTCSVSGTASAGKLIGSSSTATITNCYALGSLINSPNENKVELVTPTMVDSPATETHPYDAAFYAAIDPIPTDGSSPYTTKIYPYDRGDITVPHYGDWPLVSDDRFVYYEKYSDHSYGFYTMVPNEAGTGFEPFTFTTHSLNHTKAVILDGYGILTKNPSNITTGDLFDEAISVTEGDYKSFFPLREKNPDTAPSDAENGFYVVLEVGVNTYYYNPHFAKDAYNPMLMDGSGRKLEVPTVSTIAIRTARQLMNLDLYNSGEYRYTYQQEREIDFDTYTGLSLTVDPLFKDSQFKGTYDGQDNIIRNLTISSNSNRVGLFAETDSATLSGIRLQDAAITSTGNGATVGALVGTMSGGSVTECGVFVTSEVADPHQSLAVSDAYEAFAVKATGTNSIVGGLIGSASGLGNTTGNINNCFAAVKVTGSTAGGLIGEADGNQLKISYCYSGGHTIYGGKYVSKFADGYGHVVEKSLNITGTTAAGGFIGHLKSVAHSGVKNCYSTCSVSLGEKPSTSSTAGIFIGSYGAATPTGDNISNCYALGVAIDIPENQQNAEMKTESGGYLLDNIGLNKDTETSAYRYDKDLTTDYYPYDRLGISVTHYGDWPPGADDFGMFYWEVEGGEYHFYTNGWDADFDELGMTQTTLNDGLCRAYDSAAVTEYGYGYYYAGGIGPTEKVGFDHLTPIEDSNSTIKNAFNKFMNGNVPIFFVNDYTCVAYRYHSLQSVRSQDKESLTWSMTYGLTDHSDNPYHITASFNPDFAVAMHVTVEGGNINGSVTNGDLTDLGKTEDLSYQIRTIQQLQNINNDTYYLTPVTDVDGISRIYRYYKQTHDIYGTTYNTFRPIGNEFTPFTSKYDGNSYRIVDLSINGTASERFVGLFGVVARAQISNVTMFGTEHTKPVVSVNYSSGSLGYGAGALIGAALYGKVETDPDMTTNVIKNCAVAGYTIKNNGASAGNTGSYQGAAIGGMVGWCNLNIDRCSAVATVENHSTSSSVVRLGGMVGSGIIEITNSYVGGEVVDRKNYGRVYAAGIIAHNEVINIQGLSTVSPNGLLAKNCYSYCKVPYLQPSDYHSTTAVYTNATKVSFPLVSAAWNGVSSNDKSITTKNCYYWVGIAESTYALVGLMDNNHALQFTQGGNTLTVTRDEHPATLEQMMGLATITRNSQSKTLTEWLNSDLAEGETRFQKDVEASYTTTTTEDGISGKDRFPFPAVVTNNRTGDTLYTHHGVWDITEWRSPVAKIQVARERDGGWTKSDWRPNAYIYVPDEEEDASDNSVLFHTTQAGTDWVDYYNVDSNHPWNGIQKSGTQLSNRYPDVEGWGLIWTPDPPIYFYAIPLELVSIADRWEISFDGGTTYRTIQSYLQNDNVNTFYMEFNHVRWLALTDHGNLIQSDSNSSIHIRKAASTKSPTP